MILEIVNYGHPALRKRCKPTDVPSPELDELVANMLETMYHAEGLGLAAPQVAETARVTVIDVRGVSERPSTMKIDGKDVDLEDHMPLVLVNPVIKPFGSKDNGLEGCLSFPEMFCKIQRPDEVSVTATDHKGEKIAFEASGLLSRAVQHETDHLNGILFIDRMTQAKRDEFQVELDALQAETKAALSSS